MSEVKNKVALAEAAIKARIKETREAYLSTVRSVEPSPKLLKLYNLFMARSRITAHVVSGLGFSSVEEAVTYANEVLRIDRTILSLMKDD